MSEDLDASQFEISIIKCILYMLYGFYQPSTNLIDLVELSGVSWFLKLSMVGFEKPLNVV